MGIELYLKANRDWLEKQHAVDIARAHLSVLEQDRLDAYEKLRREAARLTAEERATLAKQMFGEAT